MWLCSTSALVGLLLFTVLDPTECLQTTVRPDKGSAVTVSSASPSDQCVVCTLSGVNDTEKSCLSTLTLNPEEEVKLLFNCSKPVEDAYTVTITRTIECTQDTCSPTTAETQPSILTEFPRTFTWDLKAPEKTVVSLNILGDGLIESSEPCADGFQYVTTTSKTEGQKKTQYCRGGSVTRLDLLNQSVVSVQVQPKALIESVLFQASAGPLKGRTMVVTIDPSTTVILSRDPKEPECEVCSVNGSTPNCSPTGMTLTKVENLLLEFSCLKPEDVYSVKMQKTIECTQSSCAPAAGEVNLDPFKDFKRSFNWDIRLPERTVLSLDFPGNGLKEVPEAESCQDEFQYTVETQKSDGSVKTKNYCKGGAVTHLEFLRATSVTAEVPKDGELDSPLFTAKSAPRGGRMMSVTPEPDTIITISRESEEPECSVCEKKDPTPNCQTKYLQLRDPRNTSVEFTCPQPQDLFNVEINREIDCTETSCSGDIVQTESSLFPEFNRLFTWDLKVVATRAFQLDFPETGMRQISNKETCPDGHTYSVVTYLRSGPATIGTFCKGGTVTTILARYKGRVQLKVPGEKKLDPVDFKLKVGPETSMAAIVKVNLPRGVSDTDFITPNYPRDFPDKEQMQWDFTVPGMHNYTLTFLDHTAPECLSGDVQVEYQKEAKKVTKLTLIDPQPKHEQGNFNLTLTNCETNKTLQGLTLNYRVSLMRSGHPVLCSVDLTKHEGVSLQLEKVGTDPYCEMSIDSKVQETIEVEAGTKAGLSFLDCPNEDVRLTAHKVVDCPSLATCSSIQLMVPKLDSCLPMPLHTFTWNIIFPQNRTVDLVSPKGSLRQSLPGQECNQSISLHIAEGNGFPIGDFCYNGAIPKIQVHTNVSVTAKVPNFSKSRGPFLNISSSKEIEETIIYNINPKVTTPTLLATPNWPDGMRPLSTLSWIVNVPSGYKAHLQFNGSWPKCKKHHAYIKVKKLGEEEEMYSRRQDDQKEEELIVDKSFYLNVSNCIPESEQLVSLTKIVLQKTSNLLAILLGIAGALLLLLIVLAIVCFITKKKKKDKMKMESSIYMGKGNIFRPGDRHFSKARSDNDSHVYDSIDEMMVYGHLLRDSTYSDSVTDHYKGPQVDSYQTFTGPVDGELPVIKEPDNEPEMDHYNAFLDPSESFIPSRPRTPIDRQDSLGFQDRRMVDNELYTFKSTGDINPIRLSGTDMEPQPPITDEYL